MSGVPTFALLVIAAMALTAGFLGLPDTARVQLAEVIQLLTAGPAHVRHQESAAHLVIPVTYCSKE